MIKFYIMAAMLAAIGALGYLYKQELSSHAETRVLYTQSQTVIEKLKNSIEKSTQAQMLITEKNLKINLELNQAKRDLEKFKGREAAYIAKPELVAKLINKDFQKDEKEMACITGDTKLC